MRETQHQVYSATTPWQFTWHQNHSAILQPVLSEHGTGGGGGSLPLRKASCSKFHHSILIHGHFWWISDLFIPGHWLSCCMACYESTHLQWTHSPFPPSFKRLGTDSALITQLKATARIGVQVHNLSVSSPVFFPQFFYQLHSSADISSVHTKTYGQCAFSHSAPTLWNNLSKAIWNSESALSFKSALKTYLF